MPLVYNKNAKEQKRKYEEKETRRKQEDRCGHKKL